MYIIEITSAQYEAIKNYGLDQLLEQEGTDSSELHHALYNTNYFKIHTSEAMKFMGDKAFDFIGMVQEYEKSEFGEITTDLSDPCKVVNMVAYIIGDELLKESETLMEAWDEELTLEQLEAIKEELA